MQLTFSDSIPSDATAVAVGVCSDQLGDDHPGEISPDWEFLERQGFEGKVGQRQLVADGGRALVAVGLGPSGDVTATILRRAAASASRAVKRHETLALPLLDRIGELDASAAAQAVAEGARLGTYEYLPYKSDPKAKKLESVVIVGAGDEAAAVELGDRIGQAVCWARDLVNEPGGDLTPAKLAEQAEEMAEREGLAITVHGKEEIAEMRMGGILGVNRGSDNPPRFIEVTYEPKGKATGSIALVGKGITFDSGGLSIKTGAGMMTMKCDMGGSAAVLGAMAGVAALAPSVKVTGYVAATDNMLGGDATRPGDVLTIRNGKTIEVLNTDAEGRLVLADALSYASEAEPDAMVDLATLTGACMVALGPKIAGLMGNEPSWIEQFEAASKTTGERVWHLPLPADYRKMCDSPIADMKNIGGPHAGALTAGLILSEFVADGIAWAHLDIAGPAFTDSDDSDIVKGGTGFGVRLLLEAIRSFEKPDSPE